MGIGSVMAANPRLFPAFLSSSNKKDLLAASLVLALFLEVATAGFKKVVIK